MVYARLRLLRDDVDLAEPYALEPLCADFSRTLDDLNDVGFDLSAFKPDGEQVEDPDGVLRIPSSVLRARLDAILAYMDLLAGLP